MSKSVLIWGAPSSVRDNIPLLEQFEGSGKNFGNILIGYGAQRLFPDELVAFRKDFKSADQINEMCSHVVIPAANLLWKEFDFSVMLPFLRQLTLPIVMIGAGAQSSNRNVLSPVHPGTMELMRYVGDRCHSIGVRGHYTAEVLASYGIHNTTVTGCPSLYMQRNSNVHIVADTTKLFSGVSVNFSRRVNGHSFNPATSRNLDNTLLELALAKNGAFVAQDEIEELTYAHGESDSTSAFTRYFDKLPNHQVEAFFRTKSRYFTTVESWSSFLRSHTLSVGSRFHGNLLALLNNVPAFCIAHDSRTLELCALLGIPHLNVAEHDSERIDVTALAELISGSSYIGFRHSVEALYGRMKLFLDRNGLRHALE